MRFNSMGWLIGYFIVCSPLHYATNGTWAWGLFNGIIGLSGAIIIEVIQKHD